MATYKVNDKMSQKEIQSYLAIHGSTIIFQKGNYIVKTPYLLYSNTNIKLEDGVVLNRMAKCYVFQSSIGKNVTKYTGCHDITITGGTIIANGSKLPTNIISIIHSKNIIIDKLTIKNNVGNHAIEINSSNNITIQNCKFDGNTQVKDCEFREAIQIDSAFHTAMPYYSNKKEKCFDGTVSTDIKILNNSFIGYNIAIGTHTQLANGNKHSNITIENNVGIGCGVLNGYGSFVRIIGMDNVTIKNNTISNFGRFCEITTTKKFYNLDSTTTTDSTKIKGCNNIKIQNNTIKILCNTFQCNGVYEKSGFSNVIHTNIIVKDNKFGNAVSNV